MNQIPQIVTERDLQRASMREIEGYVWSGTIKTVQLKLCQMFIDLEGMSVDEATTRLRAAIKRNNKRRNEKQKNRLAAN